MAYLLGYLRRMFIPFWLLRTRQLITIFADVHVPRVVCSPSTPLLPPLLLLLQDRLHLLAPASRDQGKSISHAVCLELSTDDFFSSLKGARTLYTAVLRPVLAQNTKGPSNSVQIPSPDTVGASSTL